MSKIVITNLSAISSCGVGYDALKEKLVTGVEPTLVSEYDMHKLPRETGTYVVDFEPKEILGRKGLRTMDKTAKMLLSTIHIGYADYLAEMDADKRPGLVAGTAFGSIESIGNFHTVALDTGVGSVNPKLFGNCVINSPTGNANIRFDLKNLSTTMSTGFNSGLAAVIYSADHIKMGYLPNILCAGVEEASAYSQIAFERDDCLSKTNSVKPFSKDADGVLLGDGCAVILVESEEYATAHGSEIRAEIAGSAQGFDPNNGALGFNADAEVATEIIKMALADAGIEASDVDFVVSDANGAITGDTMRAKAINAVFGDKTPVTSYRATLGETYGAAGVLDVAAAIADMEEKRVSPIAKSIDAIDGINAVQGEALVLESTYAVVTSFTLDGNCSVVVLKNR